MLRIVNVLAVIPKLLLELLALLLIRPWQRIIGLLRPRSKKHRTDPALWQALKDASSFTQWEVAAEALNLSDERLIAWKSEPRGEYNWDTILGQTAKLDEADAKWRSKEARNTSTYRDLLMPVQSRDVAYITRPQLHEYLWTGTKTAIENYIAATVRGLRTVRRSDATGARLDEKNEWFKARRMVLGRTALFLQGGSVFGLSHLGVMKALFENGLLPQVIVGTQAGALMAALVCMRTDDELQDLFSGDGNQINLNAFTMRSAAHASQKAGWKVLAARLRRWLQTGKVLDPETLEQCIMDNIGDMTFERAWQISGRNLCVTIASDAPGTPNMLSWRTSPNVLIRSAALASGEMHPDKCLDMILEKDSRGEVRPWLLNDETPSYRDRRRKRGWPSQKPPVWRVQELWHINHYIISGSRPHILPFNPGNHFWAIHKPGTPNARLIRLIDAIASITCMTLFALYLLLTFFWRCIRRDPTPKTVGLSSFREEKAITPQRRCEPVEIIPETSWWDLTAFLHNPTHEGIRNWMRKGEIATWPVIRMLHVRMDVEVELHKKYRGDPDDKPRRTLADLAARLDRRNEED